MTSLFVVKGRRLVAVRASGVRWNEEWVVVSGIFAPEVVDERELQEGAENKGYGTKTIETSLF